MILGPVKIDTTVPEYDIWIKECEAMWREDMKVMSVYDFETKWLLGFCNPLETMT